MKLTKWLAICAVILSAVAISWNIVNDLSNQAKIKLSGGVSYIHQNKSNIDDIFSPGHKVPYSSDHNKPYLVIRVTNVGEKVVVIDDLGIKESDGTKSGLAFGFGPLSSKFPLFPKTLKPGDFESYYIGEFEKLLSSTEKKIYVKSTKGREWVFDISKLDILHYNK